MTDFDIKKYQQHWEELKAKAISLSKTFVRDVDPFKVGITDEYDGGRVNCMCWQIDEGFINERIYEETLSDAQAAEDYIMSIIKDGPKCVYCIWNDGGPKSCVHPYLENCKHTTVKVKVVWTLDMMREALFFDVDWKTATFDRYQETEPAMSFDGTGNRLYSVTCSRCGKDIKQHVIDRDLVDKFEDEYDEE